MLSFGRVLVIIFILWVTLYTVSYGLWTWKKKNRLGAVAVFIIAVSVLIIPLYTLFFRQ